MTLPDCMMPDGADPCRAYQELQAELARVREQLRIADEHAAALKNAALCERERTERVARLAYKAGVQWQFDQLVPGGLAMVNKDAENEAIAQAMREAGR